MSLALEGVCKHVDGEVHLHPTDLVLEKGSMNVLLGPTLSGKTTLMRMMAGLEKPNLGRVFADGKDITGVRVQDRGVAMVYQQFINYPSMTVWENIASPLRVAGISKAEIEKRVKHAAALVRLNEEQLLKKPLQLSGGQQQRCALARALVKGADLVLLDEPLANLDYKLREELRAEIPRIFAESGAIFVYATTEPEEALLLGGNTACLHEGRVTQFGPTAQVYRNPVDAITARVFSDPPMNFITAIKEGERLTFGTAADAPACAAPAHLADGKYIAGFRGNHLDLNQRPNDTLSFGVDVAVTEITGSESFLHVDHVSNGAHNRWVALVHGVQDLPIGSRATLHLSPENVYLFNEDGSLAQTATHMAAQAA